MSWLRLIATRPASKRSRSSGRNVDPSAASIAFIARSDNGALSPKPARSAPADALAVSLSF
jgi:hypothetical protein